MLREPGGQHVLWEATRHPRQPFGPSVSDKKMMLFFFFNRGEPTSQVLEECWLLSARIEEVEFPMALTSPPPLLVVWASWALLHSLRDVKGPNFVQTSCRWATAAMCPRWQHCTDSSSSVALLFSPSPLLECSPSPGEQLFLPCFTAPRLKASYSLCHHT